MEIVSILSEYIFKPADYAIECNLVRDITHNGDCIYCGKSGYLEQISCENGLSYRAVHKFKCEYCGNTFLVGPDWVEAPKFDRIVKPKTPKPNFGIFDIVAAKIQMEKLLGKPTPIINPSEKYFLSVLDTDCSYDSPKINTFKAMKILGVKSLDKHEIKIRYRESLKLFHPDRNHFITNKDASYYIKMIKNSYNHLVEVSNIYYKNK